MTKIKDRQIKTIAQLKELTTKGGLECFILLNGGLKSSKYISYNQKEKTFYVFNYIDDSEDVLTERQIFDSACSNIGEALEKGALIMD